MNVFLITGRLVLNPLTKEDATPTYLSWLNDPEVNKYLETRLYPATQTSLLNFIKSYQNNNSLFLSIKLKENLKHIGNIKIDKIHPVHGIAEYGILMGDKLEWNKGYGKEASMAVIDYCFNKLNLRKICLGVIAEHTSAYQLYKKLGFVDEGVFKEHCYFEGQYLDVIRMAVFRDKWNKSM